MLFKCLNADGTSKYAHVAYHLPHDGQPGEWMPRITGRLVECELGYHLAENKQVLDWLSARLFEAETRYKVLRYTDKCNARQVRLLREFTTWNERTERLFACDCAERALARVANPDPRSVAAIETARRFANGTATKDELAAAAAAADAAADARAAAWAAADAAANAAAAAWAAAWAAADAAAAADARAAAWAAERDWQYQRLLQYLRGEV
jgi:hypothetical protein